LDMLILQVINPAALENRKSARREIITKPKWRLCLEGVWALRGAVFPEGEAEERGQDLTASPLF
jgi:hypothetical protein